MPTTGTHSPKKKTADHLNAEIAELRHQLEGAEETLRAIRNGEVDALVVGENLYTLQGADAESNHFRGEILAQIDDAVIAIDNDQHITFLNRATERLYGVTSNDLLGKRLSELFHQRWPAGVEKVRARSLKQSSRWRGEELHVRPGGSEVQVECSASLLRDPGGASIGELLVVREISERKHIESALRESEERYRTLFSSIDQGFCILEVIFTSQGEPTDYTFLEVNPAFERQTGLYQLRSAKMSDRLPDFEKLWIQKLTQLDAASHSIRFEIFAETIGQRWLDVFAFRVDALRGRRIALLLNDITERKMADQALAVARIELTRHAAKLEITVAERTARLAETVQELEQFSYSIAHDMRAPLRAMHGYSLILQNDYSEHLPAEAAEFLHRISTSAHRLDHLILGVLNYSQIILSELTLEPVDTTPFLRGIINSYPNLLPPAVLITIEEPIPPVMANQAAFTQIISNLLGNAVKFVQAGIQPRVRIRSEAVPHGMVRLWFIDNGIGIRPEAQERIFSLFQRLNPANTFEGTGMGLTIVRKAVERMKGRIGVTSTPGEGSRFWIELKGTAEYSEHHSPG